MGNSLIAEKIMPRPTCAREASDFCASVEPHFREQDCQSMLHCTSIFPQSARRPAECGFLASLLPNLLPNLVPGKPIAGQTNAARVHPNCVQAENR